MEIGPVPPIIGSFVPVFTLGTPGDLSVAYTAQVGKYIQIGKLIRYNLTVNFTPTWSSGAAGNLIFRGLPFQVDPTTNWGGEITGIGAGLAFPSGVLHITPRAIAGTNDVTLYGVRSAAAGLTLGIAQIVSGAALSVGVTGTYLAA
ncbi:hypothetical protein [Labrys wisconsinensis]|uniref:Uncharacterized protein n=1 Tax=Labrys wisconsinensis TaxID=425677 RepID=A0ABU0JEX7_9HYPH|nr:hypothetical protein [Labrys wisconsinensis]MDQ0472833.1 hypothetical protein [Labrys wisconsinensis]